MKILRNRSAHPAAYERRGAALLLSLLILLVLVAIVIQLNVSTGTDARMARNDVTLTMMDLAAESAILQELETLKTDAESDSSSGGAPGAPAAAGTPTAPTPAGGAGAAGAGSQPASSDSRRDEWASPQRTEINEIKLRIVVVDEDSKYNVLNMLNPDQKEADAAFDRVVRILDLCRDGTDSDIDQTTAEDMAKAMRDHMTKRKQSKLPRPKLLTDLPKNEDQGLPLSMREFMPLEPFEDSHFKDFRDSNGLVVHSITSFLTVWTSIGSAPAAAGANTSGGAAGAGTGNTPTNGNGANNATNKNSTTNTDGTKPNDSTSPQTNNGASGGAAAASGQGSAAGGAAGASGAGTVTGGYGVNVNTAPVAVLHGLLDSRDVPSRFWDKLVEWRNLEDEDEKEKAKQQQAESSSPAPEEQLDEYGEPMIKRQFFDTLQKLSDVDGYSDLPAEQQAKINQLLTTQSSVFSIYVVARKSTSVDTTADLGLTPAEQRKREETRGDTLLRVVHAVYWRHKDGQDTTMTPIVRWEVLDYLPYEVLDFPPDDR